MVTDLLMCVSPNVNCTTTAFNQLPDDIIDPTTTMMMTNLPELVSTYDHMPCLWAMFGSILVGLSGVLPLLVIPIDQTDDLMQGDKANTLKTLLSFAVGGLLGDVFLHSLPEIYANSISGNSSISSGLLVLTGLLTFVTTEKFVSAIRANSENNKEKQKLLENNNTKGLKENSIEQKQLTGYLNLISNSIDNFSHGLSLGGAFLVSSNLGALTTFAILVHEVPHEVGDFAILLKSGFTRKDAAVFQILTAGGGLMGAFIAIVFSGAKNTIEARTSWILPFTAGTFLHISLITVLPDLLKEENLKESCKQLLALIAGILVMGVASNILE